MISVKLPSNDRSDFIALVFNQGTYDRLCLLVEGGQNDEVDPKEHRHLRRIIKNAISRNEGVKDDLDK